MTQSIGHTSRRGKTLKHEAVRRALVGEITSHRFQVGDLFYSQNEIADRFGVSQKTVLRALSAIEEAGHIRRVKGRGTFVTRPGRRSSELESVLVIQHDRTQGARYPLEFAAKALARSVSRDNVEVVNLPVECYPRQRVSLPKLGKYDAIVAFATGSGIPWLAREMTDAAIVVVHPVDMAMPRHFDCIDRDYLGAPRQVLEHFRERGYDRVGVMGGSADSHHHHLRLEGTLAAVNELGLTVKPEWIVNGRFLGEEAYAVALDLLRRTDRPRAIFAFSDEMAAGVIRAAHELGMAIPEDVAVAGFDGIPFAEDLTPPLSSYYTDPGEMAQRIYEVLKARAADPESPLRNEIVKGRVIVRQSTDARAGERRTPEETGA